MFQKHWPDFYIRFSELLELAPNRIMLVTNFILRNKTRAATLLKLGWMQE